MNRENIFLLPEGAPPTFDRDEKLEKLPLPKLEETLERYYRNLLPFGSDNELENSRKLINDFKNGIGKKLHKVLEERAENERNWVEKYWEDYAYHSLRFPLAPYTIMAQPLIVASVGVDETQENRLKALARAAYYSGQFWELIRYQKLRPPTNPDGSVTFSANLFRRLYNTCRVPGEIKDEVHEYFKTSDEGPCPSNLLIVGAGRVFYFNFLDSEGHCVSPQKLLYAFRLIRDMIENEPKEPGVPILTSDERTNWYHNRKHLKELTKDNEKYLEIVESAAMTLCMDEEEPTDYSEVSLRTLDGDYHSRWSDKSSSLISFRNGKFGCNGEHSSYDGTISIAFSTFILMSLMEEPEPDWAEMSGDQIIPVEIDFQLDDHLKSEIIRMEQYVASIRNSIIVQCQQFDGYGKSFMKAQKIHPDAYVQMALQWAYYKLHNEFPPTYETATMRVFYHGRTETVRSCSVEVKDWINKMIDSDSSNVEKGRLFKEAAKSQNRLMSEARKGRGFDRHLFGLWCAAHENNIPIHALYDDPLYAKSGGGGNFTLSTSTLGYSINVGFVAPMIRDGYGIFYSMLNDCVWIVITSYRDSDITSSKKFYEAFVDAMNEIKNILETSDGSSKL